MLPLLPLSEVLSAELAEPGEEVEGSLLGSTVLCVSLENLTFHPSITMIELQDCLN